MRYLIAIALLASACTDLPFDGPRYDSVRDRMAEAPASLFVRSDASTGSITARRRISDGWIMGSTAMTVDHGYVHVELDDRGQLQIDELEIAIAPIQLDGVFSKPAQLQNVILRLFKPTSAEATWTSPDNATATLAMTFNFDWWISIDGAAAIPLATQKLPPMDVDVTLGGDGEHVGATVDLAAAGELWNWADIVQITALDLSLTAETAD